MNVSYENSILNSIANDSRVILEHADIHAIFATGTKATALYKKYCYPETGIVSITLPSTSPAKCRVHYEELYQAYVQIRKYL